MVGGDTSGDLELERVVTPRCICNNKSLYRNSTTN